MKVSTKELTASKKMSKSVAKMYAKYPNIKVEYLQADLVGLQDGRYYDYARIWNHGDLIAIISIDGEVNLL